MFTRLHLEGRYAATTPKSCIGMKRSWDPYPGWWEKRHAEKLAQIAASGGKIDIVFVGDSITHNWEGARGPGSDYGGKPLAELKKKHSVLNLGFGGDGTQHVLWRLLNGELDGYTAKCIVLMIGTNNGGKPEETVAGIKAILDLIALKQPMARVVLHPIFPSGATADHPWRVRNAKVNALIKPFADGRRVIWCDFNARFLNPDKTLKKDLMMPGTMSRSDQRKTSNMRRNPSPAVRNGQRNPDRAWNAVAPPRMAAMAITEPPNARTPSQRAFTTRVAAW